MAVNKASAMGFLLGVIFLVGTVALLGGGSQKKAPQVKGQQVGPAGDSRASASEESAESDAGTKVAEKKMVDFKPTGSEALAKAEVKGSGLRMTRSVTPGGYRSGQALDVIVSLASDGTEKLSALALVERLPKGWSFQEVSGGAKPVIVPAKDATGELTFVWVQVPAFPCTVSYRMVPGPEVAGTQELQGQGVYRQSGPEQRTELVKTMVSPAAQ